MPELRPTTPEAPTVAAFAEVLDELAIPSGTCRLLGAESGAAPGSVWIAGAAEIERAKREADSSLAADGWLLAWLP